LVGTRKGSFTGREGNNIDFWRITLRDENGDVEFTIDYQLGENLFGTVKGIEALKYKHVVVEGYITSFQGNLRVKGTDIQLETDED